MVPRSGESARPPGNRRQPLRIANGVRKGFAASVPRLPGFLSPRKPFPTPCFGPALVRKLLSHGRQRLRQGTQWRSFHEGLAGTLVSARSHVGWGGLQLRLVLGARDEGGTLPV